MSKITTGRVDSQGNEIYVGDTLITKPKEDEVVAPEYHIVQRHNGDIGVDYSYPGSFTRHTTLDIALMDYCVVTQTKEEE